MLDVFCEIVTTIFIHYHPLNNMEQKTSLTIIVIISVLLILIMVVTIVIIAILFIINIIAFIIIVIVIIVVIIVTESPFEVEFYPEPWSFYRTNFP